MDDGMQLKIIGNQLQLMGQQINNIGKQISFINNIFGNQLQNMGRQISNFSFQILDIGLRFQNINIIQGQNFNQMNNIIEQNHINNLSEPMENIIINKNINNINEEFNEPTMFIVFETILGLKTSINISKKASVNDLFNLYRIRIGENNYQNCYFILNGLKINPNESKSLLDYGFIGGEIITVVKKDVLGGPSIILKVISNGEWDIKLNGMILNDYLIKYFDKKGMSNLKKQIESLPIINILNFLKEIDDFPKK